jgi:hypothetical protein
MPIDQDEGTPVYVGLHAGATTITSRIYGMRVTGLVERKLQEQDFHSNDDFFTTRCPSGPCCP